MSKIISISSLASDKKKLIESKLKGIECAIDELDQKRSELCSQRCQLEAQIYTPKELAEINIKRKAKKVNW